MNTLSDFILARITGDEAAARYATTRDDVGDSDWAGWWLGHYQHYSRHDPARVLADCEAKRKVVELHRPSDERNRWCAYCAGTDHAEYPCETSRILALPYVDHPEYREEWKP